MEGVLPWIVAALTLGVALLGFVPVGAPWLALSGIGAVAADLWRRAPGNGRARSG